MKRLPLLALLALPAVVCWNIQANAGNEATAWVARFGVVAFAFTAAFGFVLVIGTNLGEPAGGFAMNIGPFLRVEPERGRGGSVIVYRWNEVYMDHGKVCMRGARGGDWSSGQLEANGIPDKDNEYGIYGCHDPNDVELDSHKTGHSVLVRVELRGQKAIHKRGTRGQVGTIIDFLEAEPDVPDQFIQFLRKRGFAV